MAYENIKKWKENGKLKLLIIVGISVVRDIY